jgi:hypothetical protein
MTARVADYRIRGGGPWQTLLPGVYLTHAGRPADEQREMAALLYAGPRSVLTGAAALRRHGLPAARPSADARNQHGPVDVLVPLVSRRMDVGFARLHRTGRLPAGFCVAGEARFAFVPRAVADAVRPMIDLADVRAVVADSRAWHFSPDDWEQTLARHARMSAHGIIVLHLTSQRIRSRRREVADEIQLALAAGRQLPQIRTISADQSDALTVDRRR